MLTSISPVVMIIEHEEQFSSVLSKDLLRYGFITKEVNNGDEALIMLKEGLVPDLIVIDCNLPGLSGIEICTILRIKPETKNIPIIIITNDEKFAQVKGLDRGVDDYIVRPFSSIALISKIKSIFRKVRPSFITQTLEYKSLKMDISSYKVFQNDQEIHLGPTEFKILQCLIEYPKRILSRQYIMDYVWGYGSSIENRTIDVHINRLRSAFQSQNKTFNFIKTIRAAGYSLDGPEAD